jgi:hypothetical protein
VVGHLRDMVTMVMGGQHVGIGKNQKDLIVVLRLDTVGEGVDVVSGVFLSDDRR